jgi:putative nucleotidyltransferase with HDIG domain
MSRKRPPRLLVKTLRVVFPLVAALLALVFGVVYFTVRDRVRQTVTENLEAGQRLFSAVEARRQREMRAQASNVAESPTLKAALDTYAAEERSGDESTRRELLATISNELQKVAARFDADVIVVVDAHNLTLAAAGRVAERWQAGRALAVSGTGKGADVDGVIDMGGGTFRVVGVPLQLGDGATVGTLYLATALDRRYAEDLKAIARTDMAIVNHRVLLASTLPAETAREFEAAMTQSKLAAGVIVLDGEATAFRRLVQLGETSIYATASIDQASRSAVREAARSLAFIAIGATCLALLGSIYLSGRVTEPIGRLSASLEAMAASRDQGVRLDVTGSSRELDVLTETFNAMMASIAVAETQTQDAYAGAIRALAAALDARDPYTAGHSERVSVLSVAIARVLELAKEDLEVIRLGALLHDIGKIGVPDDVLSKPSALTPAEYDLIKQHPVLGARILRPVSFLARHIEIVELHHERPDGRGYPHGLTGDDIPLAARIVHVADAYDAITSQRAYRRARSPSEALFELWRCSGTMFHAEIVGALATALPGLIAPADEGARKEAEEAGATVGV